MKKIINGRRYDTETACLVKQNGKLCHDDKEGYFYCTVNKQKLHNNYNILEALYRKRTGEYFLLGLKNGAKFAEKPNFDIYPFTESEAKEWMEYNATADEYEAAFEVEEEPENPAVTRLKNIRGDIPVNRINEIFPNISPRTWEGWERGKSSANGIVDILEEVVALRKEIADLKK